MESSSHTWQVSIQLPCSTLSLPYLVGSKCRRKLSSLVLPLITPSTDSVISDGTPDTVRSSPLLCRFLRKSVRADLFRYRGISFLSTVLNLKTSYMAGYAVIGATAVTTAGLLAL